MTLARSSLRRALIAAAGAGLLAGTLFASAAQAGPAPLAPDTAPALAARIGSPGAYFDQASARTVVTVTDEPSARRVHAAGAVPRKVARSAAQLAAITADLDNAARIPGTAWAVDPVANQVVVTADSTVTGSQLDRLKAVTGRHGDAVRLEPTAGTLSPLINGGQAIYGGRWRCSLGFNVRSGGTYYLLTAGHCTNLASGWYTNASHTVFIGPRAGSSFPGNDYGIVRYDNASVSRPGSVYLYNGTSQDITAAGNAYVGQSVWRSGSTTGVRSGRVTALNATVNYRQGTVYGLIRTTVCAEPGDSGGSLFAGNTALGLTSGGSGNCTFGGTTYFQPVTEALSVYGVSVY